MLAQLGARIQHALRAYTPMERKAVDAAAQSFRPNPALDVAQVITELGTGEALVSTLDEKGAPSMVERTLIRPPSSRLGPILPAEKAAIQAQSPCAGEYDQPMDRESAYEKLAHREDQATLDAEQARREAAQQADAARSRRSAGSGSGRQTAIEAAGMTLLRTATRELTHYVLRGIFGTRRR